jgi:hypothetical protein
MLQPCKDILDYSEMDGLDHMPLQERYRILVADNSYGSARTSAGKYVIDVVTSGTTLKR